MPTIRRNHIKLKRNSPCPCESGLKYKHCCLQKMVLQEQKVKQMINDDKEIRAMKQKVTDAMQKEIDHPILVPEKKVSKLILPEDY